MELSDTITYRILLVCAGNLVWVGYCFCTDWHWDVRERLGYHDQQQSYIHFLVLKLTGIDFDKKLVDNVTLIVFVFSLVMSIVFNVRRLEA